MQIGDYYPDPGLELGSVIFRENSRQVGDIFRLFSLTVNTCIVSLVWT